MTILKFSLQLLVFNLKITDLDTWIVSGNMSSFKDQDSACAVNSFPDMIMTGGYVDEKSTIYTSDGEKFRDLPQMPVGFYSHCMVALENDDLFVAGGTSVPNRAFLQNISYIYHSDSLEWEEIPAMPTGRDRLMCGVVRNENGEQEVITAGGGTGASYDDNVVEIYNVPNRQWRQGQYEIILISEHRQKNN